MFTIAQPRDLKFSDTNFHRPQRINTIATALASVGWGPEPWAAAPLAHPKGRLCDDDVDDFVMAVRYAGHTECLSHIEEATARYSCIHGYKSLHSPRVCLSAVVVMKVIQ